MNKKILILISIVAVIILSAVLFILTRPNTEIVSISVNEKIYKLKRNKYDYTLPTGTSIRTETVIINLYNEKDSYVLNVTNEIIYLEDSFTVVFKTGEKEKIYTFKLIDNLEEGSLQAKIDGCVEKELSCEIEGKFKLNFELKKENIILKISNNKILELPARNHNINSIIFFQEAVAFFYQDFIQPEIITLYIIDKDGEILLKQENFIATNEVILSGIETIGNKVIINSSLVKNGYYVEIDGEEVNFCLAPKEVPIHNIYEIEYKDGQLNPIKKINAYTVGQFLQDQTTEDYDPCAHITE